MAIQGGFAGPWRHIWGKAPWRHDATTPEPVTLPTFLFGRPGLRVMLRRRNNNTRGTEMYELLLIIHFLSLATGLGISITMFVLGLKVSALPPEEAGPLMSRVAGAVRHTGIVGITLLVLSGIGLVLVGSTGLAVSGGWWFRAKIILVVAVVAAVVFSQVYQARARRGENPPAAMRKAMLAGRVALASAVLATILAVIAFG